LNRSNSFDSFDQGANAMNHRRFSRLISCLPVALSLATATAAADESKEPDDQQIAELEKTLSNAALVGHFTTTGKEENSKLSEERYELGEVKHLGNDQWLIPARIKYGEHDVTLPLTLPIRWAGDTPMICLDEMPIPGFGTFTVRVIIYRDHYAGFWSAPDHGGHLFGVIERGEKKEDAAEKARPAK
jgi:hypothetical protein